MRPNYSISFWAQVNGAFGPLAVGDVVLPSATSPQDYVLATTANRAGRRAEAVVLTPFGGSGIGAIELQHVATVDASISGLAAGAASLVRVSATGRLERVTTASLTDDACGLAEADGRVHLAFGQPVQLLSQSISLPYTAGILTFLSRVLSTAVPFPVIAFQGDSLGIAFPAVSVTGDTLSLSSNGGLLTINGDDLDLDMTSSLSLAISGAPVLSSNGAQLRLGQPLAGNSAASLPLRMAGASIAIAGNTTATPAQYECVFLDLTGAPGAGFDLVLPNLVGATFNIKNGTTQTATVKKSGGTGIGLASGAIRWVRHNGTDYEIRQ